MRQQGSRYAIRAGRNLPDKEFRYLRMVIVTTAVYWGLNSPLRPKGLTGPLNLPAPGRRQSVYINLTVFARTCVFDKQSLPSLLCDPRQLPHVCVSPAWAPLLPKLRGRFAEFLHHGSPVRLGMLCPTTCVGLGYGRTGPSRRGFSRRHRITLLPRPHRAGSPSRLTPAIEGSRPDLPGRRAARLNGPSHQTRGATTARHPC